MMSMNKLLIPSILVATILVAGVFAFIPVQKATTVHEFIIAALTGDAGISNQDIIEELKDKLKLMVKTDDDVFQFGSIVGPGTVTGFTITVEALNADQENVPFNLKEVYLCGEATFNDTIFIEFVHIENVVLSGITGSVIDQDIKITDTDGGTLAIDIIDDDTCVDIVSALADSGRAGAVGLGSDSNLVIELGANSPDIVDFLKCIAFTPNEAETLVCDIEPILQLF